MPNKKYIWIAQDNQGNLIHEIDENGKETSLKVVLKIEEKNQLDMFHLANETENYSVNLKNGFFCIKEFAFYPCFQIIDVTLAKKKELEWLNTQKMKEMARLERLRISEKLKDIDLLDKEQLIEYKAIKRNIEIIEKGLSSLRYRLISFKRGRKDTIINLETGKIIEDKEGYIYNHGIGWQTTYFGKNYQQIMFISELYDSVFEIRSKK